MPLKVTGLINMKTMSKGFTLLSFCCILFLFLIGSYAEDILPLGDKIQDGDTIVSANSNFELGFFSPGSSTNRYLSIRYKNANGPIVWVAHRDTPLTDSTGTLTLSDKGTLQIVDGRNNTIWSSNASKSVSNPVAQLLDTGNLVIKADNDPEPENFIWQSFDFPDSTLLPGMKIGKNLATGLEWSYHSWKSNDDPSHGKYTVGFDVSGYPQIFLWNGSARYFRTGPWNGVRFSGVPTSGPNDIFVPSFVFNEEEVYFKYELADPSVLMRITTEPDGRSLRYTWTSRSHRWDESIFLQADYCGVYALCGAYGSCNINNSSLFACLESFRVQDVEGWRNLNFSEGCVPAAQKNCSDKDDFVKYSNRKLPDTRNSSYDFSMNLKECRNKCLKDCSCTAYANTNVTGKGSGCLLWFGGLLDIRDQEQSAQEFYVRIIGSSSGSSSSSRTKRIAMIAFLPVILILTVVLGCYLWYVCKYRKQTKEEEEIVENEADYEREDLPLFDFRTIANATKNFSHNCKIGEGGFGPVYKGVLEGGQEIAVKRGSTRSTQGVEEFKNEVTCIAKLQHRNLVKLLGWSTEEGERMLIYEYMPNKSLDHFIFGDIKQRASLDWPKRYSIINGIARGLLYLHEDSRLRVIHRDLKASNILLDYIMNPKISDFGMARSFGDTETEANTARVVGTYGYMAPEYVIEGAFSVKSDVYSFGVLLIEIVSGKKNRYFNHPDHNLNLIGHAWRSYTEDKLPELIDVSILESIEQHQVLRVMVIGLLCVQQYPDDRPNMSTVVMMLGSKTALPRPKEPGFFMERKLDQGYCPSSHREGADSSHSTHESSLRNQTVSIITPR